MQNAPGWSIESVEDLGQKAGGCWSGHVRESPVIVETLSVRSWKHVGKQRKHGYLDSLGIVVVLHVAKENRQKM